MFGQERYAENNRLLNEMLEKKKCLIAVHRGSWGGNIIQNTIPAYIAAVKMGADMVEADVNSSTDGILYSFHDHHEPDVFGTLKLIKCMSSEEIESYHPINAISMRCSRRISRLTEILDFLPENIMLNIDRAWDIFPQVLEVLDRYPNAKRQVLLKAPVREKEALNVLDRHPVKYMFMPIAYSFKDIAETLSFEGINVAAAELIAANPTDELFEDDMIERIHGLGLACWVNAITLGDFTLNEVKYEPLYAGLDDDISVISDPASGWGELFRKKIDIIQTDWPALLRDYRREVLGV